MSAAAHNPVIGRGFPCTIGLYLVSRNGGPLTWGVEWLRGRAGDEAYVMRLLRWHLRSTTEAALVCWRWRVANGVREVLESAGFDQVEIEHTHGAPDYWDHRRYQPARTARHYRRSRRVVLETELRAIRRLPRAERRLEIGRLPRRPRRREPTWL